MQTVFECLRTDSTGDVILDRSGQDVTEESKVIGRSDRGEQKEFPLAETPTTVLIGGYVSCGSVLPTSKKNDLNSGVGLVWTRWAKWLADFKCRGLLLAKALPLPLAPCVPGEPALTLLYLPALFEELQSLDVFLAELYK